MIKASLNEKFTAIQEHWRPKVVAALNGQELKLLKFRGVFPWHHHENEDELFLVWRGQMVLEFRDRDRVVLQPGEFCVVPRRRISHHGRNRSRGFDLRARSNAQYWKYYRRYIHGPERC